MFSDREFGIVVFIGCNQNASESVSIAFCDCLRAAIISIITLFKKTVIAHHQRDVAVSKKLFQIPKLGGWRINRHCFPPA